MVALVEDFLGSGGKYDVIALCDAVEGGVGLVGGVGFLRCGGGWWAVALTPCKTTATLSLSTLAACFSSWSSV